MDFEDILYTIIEWVPMLRFDLILSEKSIERVFLWQGWTISLWLNSLTLSYIQRVMHICAFF